MEQKSLEQAKVLIVDDERGNILILERLFRGAGFENVKSISDSRLALDTYLQFCPDLILLDLKMPNCDGFEVMEQLKSVSNGDYLPILILTAQRDQATRLRALEAGARDFLNKPFDWSEGLTRVRNMLEVRLLHNQIRDQNRSLEEKVRERTLELERTRLDVIQRLGRASEFRDNETGQHVVRMSHCSARLGQALGMTEPEWKLTLHASPMHDVGKIGIPDHILLKPGRLNDKEWEIMKSHTAIGGQILSGGVSPLIQMAHTIAVTHHEKWDGSGYPAGLKHEDIPLIGRVVGLCDVFDALISKRPYKRAWSVKEAMSEIEDQSGVSFDPYLVKVFKKILPEIVDIVLTYSDSHSGDGDGYSYLHTVQASLTRSS